MLSEKITFVKLLQPENVLFPILFKLFGKLTLVNCKHAENTPSAIFVIPFSILIYLISFLIE